MAIVPEIDRNNKTSPYVLIHEWKLVDESDATLLTKASSPGVTFVGVHRDADAEAALHASLTTYVSVEREPSVGVDILERGLCGQGREDCSDCAVRGWATRCREGHFGKNLAWYVGSVDV